MIRQLIEMLIYSLSSRKRKFITIYRKNLFGGDESISGPGSGLEQTQAIREALPKIIRELNVRTFVDAPCGDFHWMSKVELDIDQYIGIDIVPDLIRVNQQKYNNDNRKFLTLDIIKDDLPTADLIMCRDCFIHLSNKDIRAAINNIRRAGFKYLLTTTFTNTAINRDIVTGLVRPINLQVSPFNFPDPILLIDEKCTESNGKFSDKRLALWNVADIKSD